MKTSRVQKAWNAYTITMRNINDTMLETVSWFIEILKITLMVGLLTACHQD